MDPQRMIEQSAAVNAASVAVNEVTKLFRSSLETQVVVRVKLDRKQQSVVERETGPYVRFSQERAITNDHPIMYALREVIRTTYARAANPKHTRLKTLCVGVGWREVLDYWDNPNIYFYIHGTEAKDMSRFVMQALSKLLDTKVRTFNAKKTETVRLKIDSIQQCINTLQSLGIVPDRFVDIHSMEEPMVFHQLLFEDVGYNFSERDWLELFRKTQASQAFGYMALPYELVFENIMESDYYRYQEIGCLGNKEAAMTYDYANGYRHNKWSWSTLMRSPVIKGSDLSLAVELSARCGPMTLFHITRVGPGMSENIVRSLALPEHLRTVGVLDLTAITNSAGKVNTISPLYKYIKVRKSEMDDLINYILSLDEKSHKIQNIILYMRRRVAGVSLVTTDLISKWKIREKDIPVIALCALIYTQYQLVCFGKIMNNVDVGSWLAGVKAFLRGICNAAMEPFYWALGSLLDKHLVTKLLVGVDDVIFQQASAFQPSGPSYEYILDVETTDDSPERDESEFCELCHEAKPHLGDQKMECKTGRVLHDFNLTDTEIRVFRETLSDTDNDAVGIKEVKTRALAVCPSAGFTVEGVKVQYLRGGPGTGKSRLIKALASGEDLIVGPFSKLKADYSGDSKKLYTQHVAMTKINHKRVFVDEFTALSYEFLACIVKNVNAEEVFLVGDLGQTGIIEGVEGTNIGSKIDFDGHATHELKVDFRNPVDAVMTLNTHFNYELECPSEVCGFRFRHLDLWNNKAGEVPLCYTNATAVSLGLDSDLANKVTVRANQGQTHDHVALFITAHDINLLKVNALSVVALSRHRKSCTIYYDNNQEVKAFVSGIKKTAYDVIMSKAPYPKKNTCLLEAFCKVINSIPHAAMTPEDIWCSFCLLVGFHEARELSGAMLSSDHLQALCDDFGVSVQFRRSGFVTVLGSGELVGEISWRNNHFYASAVGDFRAKKPTYSVPEESSTMCKDGHKFSLISKVVPRNAVFTTPHQLADYRYGLYGSDVTRHEFRAQPIPQNINQVLTRLFPSFDGYVEVFRSLRMKTFNINSDKNSLYIFGRLHNQVRLCEGTVVDLAPTDVLNVTKCANVGFTLGDHDDYLVAIHVDRELPVIGGNSDEELAYDRMDEKFRQHVAVFDYPEKQSMIVEEPQPPYENPIVPLEQFGRDSFTQLKDMFDIHYGAAAQFTNEVASRTVQDKFRTGTLSGNFTWQISARGNIMQNNVKGYCLSRNAPGLYYFKKNRFQELQCLQSRYLGNKLAAECDIHGESIARGIADLFVDEHMDLARQPTQDEVNLTLRDSYRAMASKKYDKIVKPDTLGMDCETVSFHMKDIFKPFKTSVDLGKVGQGISAWSKDTQSLFQNACRVINLYFKRMLKDNVVYDNLESEEDIIRRVNVLLSDLPTVCANGVIDATACDSGQNDFTQAIERRILERMGVSETFLGWYYRFRKSYTLRGSDVSARVDGIKTSGEPATLLCNTILMMSLMNALLRGEGPCVLLGKGDDGLKRQANLKYNKVLVERFSKYTVLDFKVEIDQPVNFCGYALVGGRMYPCIIRKAFKILGHTFRDYLHFCEYQQSLRDWILNVNKLGVMETVACSAMFSGFTVDETYLIFGMLVSISHINAAQFHEHFDFVTREFESPISSQVVAHKSPLNFSAFNA